MPRLLASATLLSSFFLLLARTCSADVVYSDLNAPLVYAGGIVLGTSAAAELHVNPESPGQIFLSSGNFTLTDITVGVSYDPAQQGYMGPTGPFSRDFNIWLYSDEEYIVRVHNQEYIYHEPDSPLAELGQDLVAPTYKTLLTAPPSNTGVTVSAGTLYWIVLTPSNPYSYADWDVVDHGPESLEVDGTAITPEPATLGMLTLAAAALLPLKRRLHPTTKHR